jgi:hypothetical protein
MQFQSKSIHIAHPRLGPGVNNGCMHGVLSLPLFADATRTEQSHACSRVDSLIVFTLNELDLVNSMELIRITRTICACTKSKISSLESLEAASSGMRVLAIIQTKMPLKLGVLAIN